MARYYNRENGPLVVTFKSGKSTPVPSHTWITIPADEEGSEELLTAVRKGFLHRYEEPSEPAPAPAPEAVAPAVVEVPQISEPDRAVAEEAPKMFVASKPEKSEKDDTSEKSPETRRKK